MATQSCELHEHYASLSPALASRLIHWQWWLANSFSLFAVHSDWPFQLDLSAGTFHLYLTVCPVSTKASRTYMSSDTVDIHRLVQIIKFLFNMWYPGKHAKSQDHHT